MNELKTRNVYGFSAIDLRAVLVSSWQIQHRQGETETGTF
jgi:hypothetical protein